MSDPLHPTQSLRRRAAVAVLSDQLDDPALLQALWLQHDQMRGDAVTDIIRFIDQVAQQCGLDAGSCRRLYSEYFKALKQPSEMLPADPWSRMQALRPAPSPLPQAMAAPAVSSAPAPAVPLAQAMPVASPASAVVINPVATALASAARIPTAAVLPGTEGAATAASLAAEPVAVFAAVLRSMVEEVQKYHREALDELRKDTQRYLPQAQTSTALQAAFMQAWARPLQHDWRLPGSAVELAQLLRVVYQALAEAFGRVGAEQILQRALRAAESVPEARLYSPKRLMAAM
ncbi:MAG: hypothetical protein IPG57_12800 [Burkholderiales bacterium]|jgi:hypothetical protein|nr:hypothetical protein [Burkholderiales bacterium]MBP6250527.1 hypothetical protein [Leptothrix sp. (in: b-proteobacteria)]MBP7519854.1 hypothetical protein [Leptothrix sp. (in: b-proteobacteria)]HQY09186.1 hypothetical protein [Burkholderiaceae bacterium]